MHIFLLLGGACALHAVDGGPPGPGASPDLLPEDLRAREIYYDPEPPRPASRLGVYALDPAGQEKRTPVDTVFHEGDAIRLVFSSNRDGYATLVAPTKEGDLRVLWPQDGASAPIHAGQEARFPDTGTFRFDARPGRETLTLVLSTAPLAAQEVLAWVRGFDAPKKPLVAKASPPKTRAPTKPEGFTNLVVRGGVLSPMTVDPDGYLYFEAEADGVATLRFTLVHE